MITNGYNNGLVQLVGQAVRRTKIKRSDHRAFALAICKWGGIKNVHKLLQKTDPVEEISFHFLFFILLFRKINLMFPMMKKNPMKLEKENSMN